MTIRLASSGHPANTSPPMSSVSQWIRACGHLRRSGGRMALDITTSPIAERRTIRMSFMGAYILGNSMNQEKDYVLAGLRFQSTRTYCPVDETSRLPSPCRSPPGRVLRGLLLGHQGLRKAEDGGSCHRYRREPPSFSDSGKGEDSCCEDSGGKPRSRRREQLTWFFLKTDESRPTYEVLWIRWQRHCFLCKDRIRLIRAI